MKVKNLIVNIYGGDFFVRASKAYQIDEFTTCKTGETVEAYSQVNVFVSSLKDVENFTVKTQNNKINFIVE